mmetsp:Transcript_37861/g.79316  ORF Transcript_37861/g.79316 Transcript_37861/m.79316 type:complete len:202 (-) Transcript_37861:280-885(-)
MRFQAKGEGRSLFPLPPDMYQASARADSPSSRISNLPCLVYGKLSRVQAWWKLHHGNLRMLFRLFCRRHCIRGCPPRWLPRLEPHQPQIPGRWLRTLTRPNLPCHGMRGREEAKHQTSTCGISEQDCCMVRKPAQFHPYQTSEMFQPSCVNTTSIWNSKAQSVLPELIEKSTSKDPLDGENVESGDLICANKLRDSQICRS